MASVVNDPPDQIGSDHEKHLLPLSFEPGRSPSEAGDPAEASHHAVEGDEASSIGTPTQGKTPSLLQAFEFGRSSANDQASCADNSTGVKHAQTEVIRSDNGLGEGWSPIKTNDVVETGHGERTEVNARAEDKGLDDDFDADLMFDLDETMPEDFEAGHSDEEDTGRGVASSPGNDTTLDESPLYDPGSFRGYDLSLVIPISSSVANKRDTRFDSARPVAAAGSVPADLHFGKLRAGNLPPALQTARRQSSFENTKRASRVVRFAGVGSADSTPKEPIWMPKVSPDSNPKIRRRSTDKYDIGDESPHEDGMGIHAKRYRYRNGVKMMDNNSDEPISPMAASLPININAFPVMGWSDNGETDKISHSPEAQKGSITPRDLEEARAAEAAREERERAIPSAGSSPNASPTADFDPDAVNEPTARAQFTLSHRMYPSSVDNPITDPFATMTIGGTHRNTYVESSSSAPGGGRRIMGNPFIAGSLESPRATSMALAGPDFGTYIGSIDGRSGYDDVADRESYLRLRRASSTGIPQSFSERLMLEEEEREGLRES